MQFAKVVTSVLRILGLLQALACGKAALLLCAIPQSCGIDRAAPAVRAALPRVLQDVNEARVAPSAAARVLLDLFEH